MLNLQLRRRIFAICSNKVTQKKTKVEVGASQYNILNTEKSSPVSGGEVLKLKIGPTHREQSL